MKKEIVVARYKEDVDRSLFKSHGLLNVYDKGDGSRGWKLHNVGREAHTYLQHIVLYHDNLADVTVFLQGSPLEHFSRADLDALLTCKPRVMAGLNMVNTMEWDASGQLNEAWRYGTWADKMRRGDVRRCPLSFIAWHEKFIGPPREVTTYYMGAMFAVTREAILRRPKTWYKAMLDQVSDHVDPEEAYYLERSWPAVFKAEDEAVGLNPGSFAPGNPKGHGRVVV